MAHLMVYGFMNTGAFLFIALAEHWGVGRTFEDYNGLGSKAPMACVAMSVFMFSLAGLPPFGGFFSKYVLFMSALESALVVGRRRRGQQRAVAVLLQPRRQGDMDRGRLAVAGTRLEAGRSVHRRHACRRRDAAARARVQPRLRNRVPGRAVAVTADFRSVSPVRSVRQRLTLIRTRDVAALAFFHDGQ